MNALATTSGITRRHVAAYLAFSLPMGLAWSSASVTQNPTLLEKALGAATTTTLLTLAGVPLFMLVVHVAHASRGMRNKERTERVVLALLVGAIVSGTCMTAFPVETHPVVHVADRIDWWWLGSGIAIYLVYGGLLTTMLLNSQQALDMQSAEHAAEIARVHALRERDELRLRQLQTQIEPHFVVNVLANVKELDRRRPGSGRGLLRTLSEYLALAIAPERLAQPAVRDELTLTRKYLDILAVRMGSRLAVEIDVPDTLRDAALPPLMLGTLVENAIKHGIGPREAGGRIHIQYRQEGGDLLIRVADDGVGFRGEMGSGIGLMNTKARLAALYGERARLDLRENPGGGVEALLRIPREAA